MASQATSNTEKKTDQKRSTLGNKWSSNPWTFEIVSLVLAAAQFFAIIGVSAHFDNREPNTSSIITPNTIVSILSTGSKAALLSTAAGCIGQANWVLFAGKPRRLFDFQMVADASRGPLGSIQVLLSRKFQGGLLVRMGALITILSIAMDPFAQQLVKLQNNTVVEPGGAISQAVRYSRGIRSRGLFQYRVNDKGWIESATPISCDADFTMKAAAMFGTTATTADVTQQAKLHCPSDACEYSSLTSLAICNKCTNIDSSLERREDGNGTLWAELSYHADGIERSENTTMYGLPNGLYLDNSGEKRTVGGLVYMTMLGTSNRSRTITMGDLDTLIWSQSVIRIKHDASTGKNITWPDAEAHAMECGLYYCAKEYDFEVRNGTKREVSSQILTKYTRNPDSWRASGRFADEEGLSKEVIDSISYHPQNSIIEHTDLQLSGADGSDSWNISQDAVEGISYFTQSLFSSCTQANCSDGDEKWKLPTGFFQYDKMIGEEYKPGLAKPLWESEDISVTMDNIALSMSNALRATGDTSDKSVEGKIIRDVTTYRIEWGWIALHGTLMLAVFVFFIFTIFSKPDSGVSIPVWKTGELAVLSAGSVVSDILKGVQSYEKLEERAKEAKVTFLQAEEEYPLLNLESGPGTREAR